MLHNARSDCALLPARFSEAVEMYHSRIADACEATAQRVVVVVLVVEGASVGVVVGSRPRVSTRCSSRQLKWEPVRASDRSRRASQCLIWP